MNSHARLLLAMFLLTMFSVPVGAYSTAWCGSCHQLLVENDGLFAYNGSSFRDLTWEIRGLENGELSTLRVTNAGNLTLIYSYCCDNLRMGLYNGSLPIILKPVLRWYVGYVCDFLFYNGSIFFVANTGLSPHSASDGVFRVDPKTMNITGEWDLAWAARKMVAPENAGNTPYAWVRLGLDNRGHLWARVDMIMPNTTLYYNYHNGKFRIGKAPEGFHLPQTKPPFQIEVEEGVEYDLPSFLPDYVPTRYFLIANGTRRDVTGEILKLAYSSRPLWVLYGFYSWERNKWVVSFRMYNLPIVYEVGGNCRKDVKVDGLPLADYKGSYLILGNGTLSWRNYTVKTPRRTYYWLGNSDDEPGTVSLCVYRKDNHPVVAFLWRIHRNWSVSGGFTAYELTDEGFKIFNTTNESELGNKLVLSPYVRRENTNDKTGMLLLNDSAKTAFIVIGGRKIPINYTLANKAEAVVVGNGTFLLLTWENAYIVPPYDRPVSLLGLPICPSSNTKTTGNAFLTIPAVTILVVVAWMLRRGK